MSPSSNVDQNAPCVVRDRIGCQVQIALPPWVAVQSLIGIG